MLIIDLFLMLPYSQSYQIITCHISGIQSISSKQNATSCSPVHRFLTHKRQTHAQEKMNNNMHLFDFKNFIQETQCMIAIMKYFVPQSWHVIKRGTTMKIKSNQNNHECNQSKQSTLEYGYILIISINISP
jgi:hypothetical protein